MWDIYIPLFRHKTNIIGAPPPSHWKGNSLPNTSAGTNYLAAATTSIEKHIVYNVNRWLNKASFLKEFYLNVCKFHWQRWLAPRYIVTIFQFQEMSTTAAVWGARHPEWWPTVIIPTRESECYTFRECIFLEPFSYIFSSKKTVQKLYGLKGGLLFHQRLVAKKKILICIKKNWKRFRLSSSTCKSLSLL